MADLYPEHLIEEIKQASDIVDVLSDFLKLKKRGANFLCNCPFHTEKTPSFSVSSSKQIYHCFGCGKGGNVYTFLMEHEKLSFIEALKFLAKRAGITLPERKIPAGEKSRYDQIFYANQIARKFFKKLLWETEDGHKVIKYLKQTRGMSDETINHFDIGFAPDAWDKFLLHARGKDLTEDDLLIAGLIVKREDGSGHYDRFRRRLMFPINNFTGKTIAFGGRALAKEDRAKYINSPETDLYNKSKILYGLNYARSFIRESGFAIIVEGYMDYVTLWQAGFKNIVASSGTAFTQEQARLISRYAPKVVTLFDSDTAGITAVKRCAAYLMNAELDFRAVLLPKGEDPDSFIKSEGSEAMTLRIENAVSIPEFIFGTLDPPFEKLSVRQKEIVLKELVELSAQSDSSIRRELFLKDVSAVFDIDISSLKSDLEKAIGKIKSAEPVRKSEQSQSTGMLIQKEILSVLLHNPNLLDKALLSMSSEDLSEKNIRIIYDTMQQLKIEGFLVEASKLIDQETDLERQNLISSCANTDLGTEDTERLFDDLIMRLKMLLNSEKRHQLIEKITSAEKTGDQKSAQKYSAELVKLKADFDTDNE
jgi:DNA primase